MAAQKAASVLRQGGIVLFPTDTLYGLAVDATNPKAVHELRALKGREPHKPLSVIVSDLASMKRYAVVTKEAEALAERFLPGPLTLVLRATKAMPVTCTFEGTIGMRIPDEAFCLALAREFGKPFTATSANKSGLESLGTVDQIIEQLAGTFPGIALAIDGGEKSGTMASTIVRLTSDTPEVLREGVLTREDVGL